MLFANWKHLRVTVVFSFASPNTSACTSGDNVLLAVDRTDLMIGWVRFGLYSDTCTCYWKQQHHLNFGHVFFLSLNSLSTSCSIWTHALTHTSTHINSIPIRRDMHMAERYPKSSNLHTCDGHVILTIVMYPRVRQLRLFRNLLFLTGNHASSKARTRDRWLPHPERTPTELRLGPHLGHVLMEPV
jgi:hypothetical protein